MQLVNKNLSEGKIMKILWYGGLSLLATIPSVLAVLYSPLTPDSSYYLSVVDRLNDGYKFYVDFNIGYTPLYFYFLLGLKKIFNIGISYEFYLTVHFILQYFVAFYVYKNVYELTKKHSYSFYASILFVLMSHWNEGNAVLLETPSLFFGMLGLYFILIPEKKPIANLLIGFLFTLSFLVKQYGFGFFILGLCYSIFSERELKNVIYLILGFITPLFLLLMKYQQPFLAVIGGGGYGGGMDFASIAHTLIGRTSYLFIRISPVILITYLFSIFVIKGKEHRIKLLIITLGVFGFMLQFLFASFTHYYLYVIPFVSILIFFVFNNVSKYKRIYAFFVILTFMLSVYSTYYNRVYKIYINARTIKEGQISLAKKIIELVPQESNLYIADVGLIPMYYLSNRLPPNLKTTGYSFGIALTPEQHLNQIVSADFVLKYKHEYNDFNLSTEKTKNEFRKLRFIELNNSVLLYIK